MIPDNAIYFKSAYTVALLVYTLYTVLLFRRRARVRAALEREGGGR